MNEDNLKLAYDLFVKNGYEDSFEDFNELIKSNEDAFGHANFLLEENKKLNEPVDFDVEPTTYNINLKDLNVPINESISITQEEINSIRDEVNAPPVKKRKVVSEFRGYGGGMMIPTEGEEYDSYIYDDFLNNEKNNHKEAKQMYVDKKVSDLLKQKYDSIAEDIESEVKPLFSFFDTESDYEYKKIRKIKSEEYRTLEKEKLDEYTKISNNLTDQMYNIKSLEDQITRIYNRYTKNPESLTQYEIDQFNLLQQNRVAQVTLFNEQLDTLNQIEFDAKNFNTIADLLSRSYNNLEITGKTIHNSFRKMRVGLLDFKNNIRIPGLYRNILRDGYNIDIYDEKQVETLSPVLKEIAKASAEKLKKEDEKTLDIRKRIEKTQNQLAKPVEFKDIGKSFENFGMFTLELLSNQVANTVVTATTGNLGLAIVASSAAGEQFYQQNEQINEFFKSNGLNGKDINPFQYYVGGVGYGLAEYVTERIALKQFEGAKKALRNFVRYTDEGKYSFPTDTEVLKNFAKRYGINVNEEGSAELFAALSQRFIDDVILEEDVDFADYFSAGTEGYISGAIMSGLGFQAPAIASQMYQTFSTKSEWREISDNGLEIQAITQRQDDLRKNSDMNDPDVQQAILEMEFRKEDLIKRQYILKGIHEKRMDDLSKKDVGNLLNLEGYIYKLKRKYGRLRDNKKIKDEDKKSALLKIEKTLDDLYVKKAVILNSAVLKADKDRLNKFVIEAEKLGLEINNIFVKKGENVLDKIVSFIQESNLEEDVKKNFIKQVTDELTKVQKDGDIVHGSSFGVKFGLPITVQIEENAILDQNGNATVVSHELGHATILRALINQGADIVELANRLESFLYKNYSKLYDEYIQTHKNYKGKDAEYVAEEKLAMTLDFIRFYKLKPNKSLSTSLLSIYNKIANKNKKAQPVNEIKTGEDVFKLLKSFAFGFESGEISKLAKDLLQGKLDLLKKEITENKKTRKGFSFSKKSQLEGIDVETLIEIYKLTDNDLQKELVFEEIQRQYNLIGLKAIKYDTRKGDIPRENVISALAEYLPGIIERFTPTNPETGKKRKFSTFVTNTLIGRAGVVYEQSKTREFMAESTDGTGAKQIIDDVNDLNNKDSENLNIIDILSFEGVKDIIPILKRIINVKPGEKLNFKQLFSRFSGKVGEKIFNIPAEKITDSPKNVTKKRKKVKVVDGVPVLSESDNIQAFFQKPGNIEKFLKIMPIYTVSTNEANVNEQGQQAQVSKENRGISVIKSRRVKDYFYEPYVDPRSNSQDPSVRKQAITSPGGRSKGVSTQTAVKKLKPKFINPTVETINELKSELGLTPRNQKNISNDYINQFLKGLAQLYSEQASISLYTRVKQDQGETDVASATAAQSKMAFSRVTKEHVEEKLNRLLEDKNLPKIIYTVPNDDYETYVTEELVPFLEYMESRMPGFITKTNAITSSTIKNKKNGAKNKDEAKKLLNKLFTFSDTPAKYKTKKFDKKFLNEYIGGRRKFGREKLTLEQLNNVNTSMFKEMWGNLYDFIRSGADGKIEDVQRIVTMLHWLRGSVNEGKHAQRAGAIFTVFDKAVKAWKFEHALQNVRTYELLTELIITSKDKADYLNKLDLVMQNYQLWAISIPGDDNLVKTKYIDENGKQRNYGDHMGLNFDLFKGDKFFQRYFNEKVFKTDKGKNLNPETMFNLTTDTSVADEYNINAAGGPKNIDPNVSLTMKNSMVVEKSKSISYSKTSRGMSTFDFDETLIDKGENFIIAIAPDNSKEKISSAEWPTRGSELQEQGYTFDFNDFINVRGGVEGPLLQKMRNQIEKFGPDNVYVLTARPPESATAIHGWLKTKDINIPLENITGLGNSTGEAKAQWMLEKFEQGYNDMYFVDDALQNVKAVKEVLDQLDIKSDVQQVKINFSKDGGKEFNEILEQIKGVSSIKKFGEKTAARMGAGKGRYRFFVPPSHEDFIGLLYNFMGKGKAGNRHRKFFEDNLIKPLNRAFVNLNKARQAISNDYVNLIKKSPNVKKLLNKKVPGTEYFYSDAVRVYLWDKFNFNIPGLLDSEIKELVDVVNETDGLKTFADGVGLISRQENGYVEPSENWQVGDIRTDLQDATGRIGRNKFFQEFKENADIIFSQENLNKIEALYGTNLKESIVHMIDSIKTGKTRNPGDKRTNQFLDYINGSVGATMFFNIRSMLLQQLSNINFINWGDNNVFKASAAFANQKQYWNDFAFLFNSDFLKQRRSGIAFDVNGNELAKEISKSKEPFRATVRFLLQKGFAPTQFGDSLAIAMGGATMYRNRIKTYLKQGLSKAEAERRAFQDFVEVAEATQQSARMDMIGMQQKLPIGKILLAFQNYGSQVVRIKKKAVLDLINRRITPPYKTQKGSDMANVSKIIHYAVIQNVLFHGLQTAIFALAFSDDDEDRELLKTKSGRFYNGMVDTILRGTGIAGGVVSVLKNTAIAWVDEQEKPVWKRDKFITFKELLKISPPLSIKERKISQADNTRSWDEKLIKEMPLTDIDNPIWPMIFKYVEGITNLPIDNAYQNYQNLKAASDSEITWWKRLALFAGWSRWDVGVKSEKIEKIKEEIKQKKKKETKKPKYQVIIK